MNTLDDKWIDLYQVLGVEVHADEKTIEKKLREFQSSKRDDYHPQLAAQCRRILLDADCRARYNRVRAQHRAGSLMAMDFQDFVSTIQHDDTRRQLTRTPAKISEPAPPVPTALLAQRRPALSRNSINLMTGIVATLLINYIQTGTSILPGL